jgi:hypothetical protein
MSEFTLTTEQDRLDVIYYIQNSALGETVTITRKRRTSTQNSSIHLYAGLLANRLNDAGFDKKAVYKLMKDSFSVPWTMESIKSDLWSPIQQAMYGTASTTKLNTKQVSEVYLTLDKWTGSNTGITLPFPNRFEM